LFAFISLQALDWIFNRIAQIAQKRSPGKLIADSWLKAIHFQQCALNNLVSIPFSNLIINVTVTAAGPCVLLPLL
jgi:hypothetical protein